MTPSITAWPPTRVSSPASRMGIICVWRKNWKNARTDTDTLTSIHYTTWPVRKPVPPRWPRESALAHEFVAFESGRYLISEGALRVGSLVPLATHHLAHASQIDHLRALMVQGYHIFDGAIAQIGVLIGRKQDSSGADVLGYSRKRHALGAGACDGEWELELKAPGSS